MRRGTQAARGWRQLDTKPAERKGGDDEAALPVVLRPCDRATPLGASRRLSLTPGGHGSALKALISPQAGQGGSPGTTTLEPVLSHHRVCPRSLLGVGALDAPRPARPRATRPPWPRCPPLRLGWRQGHRANPLPVMAQSRASSSEPPAFSHGEPLLPIVERLLGSASVLVLSLEGPFPDAS